MSNIYERIDKDRQELQQQRASTGREKSILTNPAHDIGVLTVEGANGKPCVRVGGSCSCCCAQDRDEEPGRRPWYVYRAGWSDGESYYARLCGDAHGIGCISEVMPATPKEDAVRDGLTSNEAATILRDLMPGEEDDGIVTEMEDFFEGSA